MELSTPAVNYLRAFTEQCGMHQDSGALYGHNLEPEGIHWVPALSLFWRELTGGLNGPGRLLISKRLFDQGEVMLKQNRPEKAVTSLELSALYQMYPYKNRTQLVAWQQSMASNHKSFARRRHFLAETLLLLSKARYLIGGSRLDINVMEAAATAADAARALLYSEDAIARQLSSSRFVDCYKVSDKYAIKMDAKDKQALFTSGETICNASSHTSCGSCAGGSSKEDTQWQLDEIASKALDNLRLQNMLRSYSEDGCGDNNGGAESVEGRHASGIDSSLYYHHQEEEIEDGHFDEYAPTNDDTENKDSGSTCNSCDKSQQQQQQEQQQEQEQGRRLFLVEKYATSSTDECDNETTQQQEEDIHNFGSGDDTFIVMSEEEMIHDDWTRGNPIPIPNKLLVEESICVGPLSNHAQLISLGIADILNNMGIEEVAIALAARDTACEGPDCDVLPALRSLLASRLRVQLYPEYISNIHVHVPSWNPWARISEESLSLDGEIIPPLEFKSDSWTETAQLFGNITASLHPYVLEELGMECSYRDEDSDGMHVEEFPLVTKCRDLIKEEMRKNHRKLMEKRRDNAQTAFKSALELVDRAEMIEETLWRLEEVLEGSVFGLSEHKKEDNDAVAANSGGGSVLEGHSFTSSSSSTKNKTSWVRRPGIAWQRSDWCTARLGPLPPGEEEEASPAGGPLVECLDLTHLFHVMMALNQADLTGLNWALDNLRYSQRYFGGSIPFWYTMRFMNASTGTLPPEAVERYREIAETYRLSNLEEYQSVRGMLKTVAQYGVGRSWPYASSAGHDDHVDGGGSRGCDESMRQSCGDNDIEEVEEEEDAVIGDEFSYVTTSAEEEGIDHIDPGHHHHHHRHHGIRNNEQAKAERQKRLKKYRVERSPHSNGGDGNNGDGGLHHPHSYQMGENALRYEDEMLKNDIVAKLNGKNDDPFLLAFLVFTVMSAASIYVYSRRKVLLKSLPVISTLSVAGGGGGGGDLSRKLSASANRSAGALQARTGAESTLRECVNAGDSIPRLMAAIEAAEACGVEKLLLQKARAKLQTLKKKKVAGKCDHGNGSGSKPHQLGRSISEGSVVMTKALDSPSSEEEDETEGGDAEIGDLDLVAVPLRLSNMTISVNEKVVVAGVPSSATAGTGKARWRRGGNKVADWDEEEQEGQALPRSISFSGNDNAQQRQQQQPQHQNSGGRRNVASNNNNNGGGGGGGGQVRPPSAASLSSNGSRGPSHNTGTTTSGNNNNNNNGTGTGTAISRHPRQPMSPGTPHEISPRGNTLDSPPSSAAASAAGGGGGGGGDASRTTVVVLQKKSRKAKAEAAAAASASQKQQQQQSAAAAAGVSSSSCHTNSPPQNSSSTPGSTPRGGQNRHFANNSGDIKEVAVSSPASSGKKGGGSLSSPPPPPPPPPHKRGGAALPFALLSSTLIPPQRDSINNNNATGGTANVTAAPVRNADDDVAFSPTRYVSFSCQQQQQYDSPRQLEQFSQQQQQQQQQHSSTPFDLPSLVNNQDNSNLLLRGLFMDDNNSSSNNNTSTLTSPASISSASSLTNSLQPPQPASEAMMMSGGPVMMLSQQQQQQPTFAVAPHRGNMFLGGGGGATAPLPMAGSAAGSGSGSGDFSNGMNMLSTSWPGTTTNEMLINSNTPIVNIGENNSSGKSGSRDTSDSGRRTRRRIPVALHSPQEATNTAAAGGGVNVNVGGMMAEGRTHSGTLDVNTLNALNQLILAQQAHQAQQQEQQMQGRSAQSELQALLAITRQQQRRTQPNVGNNSNIAHNTTGAVEASSLAKLAALLSKNQTQQQRQHQAPGNSGSGGGRNNDNKNSGGKGGGQGPTSPVAAASAAAAASVNALTDSAKLKLVSAYRAALAQQQAQKLAAALSAATDNAKKVFSSTAAATTTTITSAAGPAVVKSSSNISTPSSNDVLELLKVPSGSTVSSSSFTGSSRGGGGGGGLSSRDFSGSIPGPAACGTDDGLLSRASSSSLQSGHQSFTSHHQQHQAKELLATLQHIWDTPADIVVLPRNTSTTTTTTTTASDSSTHVVATKTNRYTDISFIPDTAAGIGQCEDLKSLGFDEDDSSS
jgi:hypothetical protein